MKKTLLIIFVCMFISVSIPGCGALEPPALWEKLNGREFSNYDVWAGTGISFYEDDGRLYFKYMIYGSGVPIINEYTAEITEIMDNEILIELPVSENHVILPLDEQETVINVFAIDYIDGNLHFDGKIYKERP